MSEQTSQTTVRPTMSMFQSMLAGAAGGTSSARVGILTVLVSATAWVSYCVWLNHQIPDLSGLTFYVTSVVGVLYGTNKATEVITAIKSKNT